jgi:hypothetical protein
MRTTAKMPAAEQAEHVRFGRLLWASVLSALAAAVMNTGLYWAGAAFGAFPATLPVPPGNDALSLAQVLIASVVGVFGGGILLLLLGRLVRRPARRFRQIAGTALLISLLLPLTVPGGSPLFYAVLLFMHLITGGLALWLLPAYAVHR